MSIKMVKIKLSLLQIIKTDYIAMIAIVSHIVIWIMYLIITFFGFIPGLRGHNPLDKEAYRHF